MTAIRPRLWTVEEYHQMREREVLHPEERVELLQGQVLQMAPKNPPHAATNLCAANLLNQRLVGKALVRIQDPIALSSFSEPEPNIAVVHWKKGYYGDRHPLPSEVYLLIEIADTTLKFDRTEKAPIYATAGITDYWILDVNTKQIYVLRQPHQGRYQEETILDETATISLLAFPEITIAVDQLFA